MSYVWTVHCLLVCWSKFETHDCSPVDAFVRNVKVIFGTYFRGRTVVNASKKRSLSFRAVFLDDNSFDGFFSELAEDKLLRVEAELVVLLMLLFLFCSLRSFAASSIFFISARYSR